MNFREYHNKKMQDPEFKKEYESLAPELAITNLLCEQLDAGKTTIEELAQRTGISESEIEEIKNGTNRLSIRTAQKLLNGLGYTIKLVPLKKSE